jgi:hypothetical protein
VHHHRRFIQGDACEFYEQQERILWLDPGGVAPHCLVLSSSSGEGNSNALAVMECSAVWGRRRRRAGSWSSVVSCSSLLVSARLCSLLSALPSVSSGGRWFGGAGGEACRDGIGKVWAFKQLRNADSLGTAGGGGHTPGQWNGDGDWIRMTCRRDAGKPGEVEVDLSLMLF